MNYTSLFRIGLLFLFSLALAGPILGQSLDEFEQDYTPLRMEGTLPQEAIEQVSKLTDRDLRLDEGELGEDGYSYYAYSNYALSKAFQSGEIYFGGEITKYLSELLDTLLVDQPDLRADLKVYGTRIGIANASSWRDGTVFLNIPLLVYLENEAQLAFILAHEISHFQKKHVLRQFRKIQEVGAENIGAEQDTEQLMEVLRYSRIQELEADSMGLQTILASPYNASEALTALAVLKEIDEPNLGDILDMHKLFGMDSLPRQDRCLCDSSDIFLESDRLLDGASLLGLEEDLEEPVSYPDSLATHPSVDSRIETLVGLLARLGGVEEKQNYVLGKERFNRIQLIAFFEFVQKDFEKGRYASSLYTSLRMLQDFPDNRYLNLMAARNMYWLAFYNDRGDRRELYFDEDHYQTLSYGSYACMMRRLPNSAFHALARMFIAQKQEKFPDEPEYMILRAQTAELVGNTSTAKTYYQAYLDAAPNGPLHLFAEYRLSQQ